MRCGVHLSSETDISRFYASQVPALSSNPGAAATIYLDFNGHDHDGAWAGRDNVTTPAFDVDGKPSTFSPRELELINKAFLAAAEDFAPFDVNVTTVNPGDFSDGEALRVAIGGHPSDWFTTEDDMAVLSNDTNGFGYRADDHGDVMSTATNLQSPWIYAYSDLVTTGIIEQMSDADFFKFTTSTTHILRFAWPQQRGSASGIHTKADNGRRHEFSGSAGRQGQPGALGDYWDSNSCEVGRDPGDSREDDVVAEALGSRRRAG